MWKVFVNKLFLNSLLNTKALIIQIIQTFELAHHIWESELKQRSVFLHAYRIFMWLTSVRNWIFSIKCVGHINAVSFADALLTTLVLSEHWLCVPSYVNPIQGVLTKTWPVLDSDTDVWIKIPKSTLIDIAREFNFDMKLSPETSPLAVSSYPPIFFFQWHGDHLKGLLSFYNLCNLFQNWFIRYR